MDKMRYELSGGIAQITLDDGKANVMSGPFFAELGGLLDRAEAEGARVVVWQLNNHRGLVAAGSSWRRVSVVFSGFKANLQEASFGVLVNANVFGQSLKRIVRGNARCRDGSLSN